MLGSGEQHVIIGHYRVATSNDVEAIVALVEVAYRSESSSEGWTTESRLVGGSRTSIAEITDAVHRPDSCMLVGEITDVIVSCCRLTMISAETVHFGLFCVDPLRQSNGLGRELLNRAMIEARLRFGATRVTLYVIAQRDELRQWYEHLGFTPTGEHLPFSHEADPALVLVPEIEFIVYERTIDLAQSPLD